MAENPVVAGALEAESDFLGAGGDVGLRGDKINRYGGNGPGNQATFTMGYSSLHCRVYGAMRQSLLDVGGWEFVGRKAIESTFVSIHSPEGAFRKSLATEALGFSQSLSFQRVAITWTPPKRERRKISGRKGCERGWTPCTDAMDAIERRRRYWTERHAPDCFSYSGGIK